VSAAARTLAKTTAAKHAGSTIIAMTVAVRTWTVAMSDWQFYLILLRELWPMVLLFAIVFAAVVVFFISLWRAFTGKDYSNGTYKQSNT
jgi:glucan phosphoethanolaminetransferase (alkaline phosphatase superfamily)